ncbi:hypothetical protein SAMN05660690_1311 [Geodermatophilus telluris]|uniref:Uncharacterized protein n=1 Tax=Geodermatophilus telluris TaxID=1190417 RepID=A0A1G6LBZ6_9ACTN|nr:hypothetical protein [Geodermatophilus telluris]SDC40728.1 hypothetical protein SAMN05660690_1311 [Geodermatophilus telluris]
MDPLPDLREFDVHPFPLRVAVHWVEDGLQVELVVVTAADGSGYSSVPITSHTVPYAADRGSERSVDVGAAVEESLAVFAHRLARAVGGEGGSGSGSGPGRP